MSDQQPGPPVVANANNANNELDHGLSVLGALILVREKRCRVTFLEGECVIEQFTQFVGDRADWTPRWTEIGRADTFLRAVYKARETKKW